MTRCKLVTLLTLICPQLLIEKFREFARDTTNTGTERVAATNAVCDQLIGTGHSDAATIAEWKDQINQSWADLLELIETRTKVSETCLTETCLYFVVLKQPHKINVRVLSLLRC